MAETVEKKVVEATLLQCFHWKCFASKAKKKSQKKAKYSAINNLIHLLNTYAVVVVTLPTKPVSVINMIAYVTFPDLWLWKPLVLGCFNLLQSGQSLVTSFSQSRPTLLWRRRRHSNVTCRGNFYFSSVAANTTQGLSVTLMLQSELIHTLWLTKGT